MVFSSNSIRWIAFAKFLIVIIVLVGTAPSVGKSQTTPIPFSSVPASATTVSFETTPQGNPIAFDTPAANIWASIGVTFDANDDVDGPFTLRSPPNILAGGPLGFPPIRGTFNPAVSLTGAWGFDFVMESFDSAGNSLGAIIHTDGTPGLSGGENEFGFLGVTSSTPIATVEFRHAFPNNQAFGFHIDDLVFLQGPPPPIRDLIAFTEFDEPSPGASSYTPAAAGRELGFSTESTPSGGVNTLVGVALVGDGGGSPAFSHRSINATTTFDDLDLATYDDVSILLRMQVADTAYEAGDFARVYVTNGSDSINLLNFMGPVLDNFGGDGFLIYQAAIPNDWTQATLVIASSTNSTQGAERFDFDSIEFRGVAVIPEPATWILVLGSLVAAACKMKRRSRVTGEPARGLCLLVGSA